MEVVLQESKKIVTNSERQAEEIAKSFKTSHKVKRAVITKKTKRTKEFTAEYWVVEVVIELAVEKEVVEQYILV